MDVSGQLQATAALLRKKKNSGTQCIGVWVGARDGLDVLEERKIPAGNRNPDRPAHSLDDYTVW
jgi:hypothetical protein